VKREISDLPFDNGAEATQLPVRGLGASMAGGGAAVPWVGPAAAERPPLKRGPSDAAATASGPGESALRSAKLATRYVAAAAERAARANSRRAFDAMANDERINLDGWLPTVSASFFLLRYKKSLVKVSGVRRVKKFPVLYFSENSGNLARSDSRTHF